MHFGLIPRTNRGIFCINELPDLSPKIQVGLFNVLEERDIQIRGYPIRLELDLCLVFSANPEDYTNRGRIVTPLKDRLGSVVLTHYPLTRELGVSINDANAWVDRGESSFFVPMFMKEIVEETARLARVSPHVNQASGVSVRMSIANLENVVSNAERRALATGERYVVPRPVDLAHLIPSSRGKLELAMSEGEGHEDKLIGRIVDEAIKVVFDSWFSVKDLRGVIDHFESGDGIELSDGLPAAEVLSRVEKVPGLRKKVDEKVRDLAGNPPTELREATAAALVELVLEGLHVHNKLNKSRRDGATSYRR
jgi:magnesium chelatase subunit I